MPLDYLISLFSGVMTPLAILVGVVVIMRYLNRSDAAASGSNSSTLAEVTKKLQELEKIIVSPPPASANISATEKEKLLLELQSSMRSEAAQMTLAEIKTTIAKEVEENAELELIRKQCERTIHRLERELFSLTRRGNLNLAIGTMTAMAGLYFLGTFVVSHVEQLENPTSFLAEFFPRISLVVLIEVFAYFFLRLYKSSLTELKYFQNEVTSMEAKYLAFVVAAQSGKDDHLEKVIDNLSRTERNFILNKDQTTVDLERAKMDHQERTTVWSNLSEVLKKAKVGD